LSGKVHLTTNKDGTLNVFKGGLTEEEKNKKFEEKWENLRKEIEDDRGFSKVIQLLISCVSKIFYALCFSYKNNLVFD